MPETQHVFQNTFFTKGFIVYYINKQGPTFMREYRMYGVNHPLEQRNQMYGLRVLSRLALATLLRPRDNNT